jgi:hypothetical protein
MTTQHQAPEVTSELRECPFDGAPALTAFVQAGISWWQVECSKCTAHVDAPTEAEAITAWNTRATQPLSLTVDEGVLEAVAIAIWENDCATYLPVQWENDPDHWRRYARAAINRLQSLSLPVDIDRSGLAQEVE